MTTNPNATQGRIVLTLSDDLNYHPSGTCPAIVVEVNGPENVDLYVLDRATDIGERWVEGCGLYSCEEEAREARRLFGQRNACFWPPRV